MSEPSPESAGQEVTTDVLAGWLQRVDFDVVLLAATTAVLLETEHSWISRRTDRFSFLDGRRLHKESEIEFTVPRVGGAPGELLALPIARPRKRFLRNVRLVDETGRALTYFTRDRNALVSTQILALQAAQVLEDDEEVAVDVLNDFTDVVGLRPSFSEHPSEKDRRARARHALRRFEQASAGSQHGRLWADPILRAQVMQLSERFVMFLPAPGAAGVQRTVTLSYESEVDLDPLGASREGKLRWRNARQTLVSMARGRGPGEHAAAIITRGPFSAASYHAEVLVPEDLTVVGARLRMVSDDPSVSAKPRVEELCSDRSTPRVHLFCNYRAPRTPDRDPRGTNANSLCFIRIRMEIRTGIVLPVVVAAASLVGVLSLGMAARAAGYLPEGTTVAAVLLAFPALYAAYLIPQGHALMRRMFTGFRAMLVALTLLAYGAASTLAINLTLTDRYVIWAIADAVALACLWIALTTLARTMRGALLARGRATP